MQCFLGTYPGMASQPEHKFMRALESVCKQTVPVELVVIADGCEITKRLYPDAVLIDKAPIWSGIPRNKGIELASGDLICYLDHDDYLSPEHCEKILEAFIPRWAMMPDNVYKYRDVRRYQNPLDLSHFKQRRTLIQSGYCGTANIVHRKDTPARWRVLSNYAHDWHFIQELVRFEGMPKVLNESGYYVCHIPNQYDV